MFVVLGIVVVVAAVLKLVVALCGHSITWRLAFVMTIAVAVLIACLAG
jgi:hypothetical protein